MPELPNPKSKRNLIEDKESEPDKNSESPSMISASWNENQEKLLKGISERSNCMRWLHNQCNLYYESVNFYLTIPNVIISTLNGGFTMSLTSLFPEPSDQKVATTIIGLISIFSGVLITMNQYMKSQQMMEAHRSAALSYSKLHRLIQNELSLTRDQRMMAQDFMKMVRSEQDRLENTSPSILPNIILKFNIQFENRNIEKPEIAGDLDETEVNAASRRHKKHYEEQSTPVAKLTNVVSQLVPGKFAATAAQFMPRTMRKTPSFTAQHDNDDRPDTPPLPGSQRNEVVVQIKDQ